MLHKTAPNDPRLPNPPPIFPPPHPPLCSLVFDPLTKTLQNTRPPLLFPGPLMVSQKTQLTCDNQHKKNRSDTPLSTPPFFLILFLGVFFSLFFFINFGWGVCLPGKGTCPTSGFFFIVGSVFFFLDKTPQGGFWRLPSSPYPRPNISV